MTDIPEWLNTLRGEAHLASLRPGRLNADTLTTNHSPQEAYQRGASWMLRYLHDRGLLVRPEDVTRD